MLFRFLRAPRHPCLLYSGCLGKFRSWYDVLLALRSKWGGAVPRVMNITTMCVIDFPRLTKNGCTNTRRKIMPRTNLKAWTWCSNFIAQLENVAMVVWVPQKHILTFSHMFWTTHIGCSGLDILYFCHKIGELLIIKCFLLSATDSDWTVWFQNVRVTDSRPSCLQYDSSYYFKL